MTRDRHCNRMFRSVALLLMLQLLPLAVSAQQAAAPIRFEVQGNSLLPAAEIARATPAIPAPANLEAIQATANRLQQAYRDAGYGAVIVTLPEQTVSADTIRLQVIEGKLKDVYLQGNQDFSDANIRRSLPHLKEGETPNLLRVDADALQANENPAKAVRVTFQPGQAPGQVDALVVTRERDPAQYSLGLDNTGNNSTGRYRSSLAYQNANAFGRDHVLGARVELAPAHSGRSNAASLSYLLPLYTQRSALELSASYSDVESKAIATAAGDALFAGKGSSLGLRYRWYLPRIGLIRQRLQMGLDLRQYENDCSLGEFGSAGCGTASADIDVHPLSIAYDARTDRFAAGLQFSRNAWASGAHGSQQDFENARAGAEAKYNLLRGNLSSFVRFDTGLALALRAAFQYSGNALISAEQNGQGGADTVRGYQERELVGDKGMNASMELSSPPWRLPDFGSIAGTHELNALVFSDWGRVSNNKGSFCDEDGRHCSLYSVGTGLRWNYHERAFLRSDVARALRSTARTPDGDYRLHFLLGYGF